MQSHKCVPLKSLQNWFSLQSLSSEHVSKPRQVKLYCSGPGLFESRLTLAIPGFKVSRSINFSCIKLLFSAYVLCSLQLFKLKTEGHTK